MAIPFIYSFSGNCAASAPISTLMCLWAIYIFPGSVHIFPPAEKVDPSWKYLINSQTHECGNWDWGPDIPFLGIFVSNFRHFVFAVCISWEPTMVCEIHLRSLPIEHNVYLENRLLPTEHTVYLETDCFVKYFIIYKMYYISWEPTIVCEIHLRSLLQNVPYILRTNWFVKYIWVHHYRTYIISREPWFVKYVCEYVLPAVSDISPGVCTV